MSVFATYPISTNIPSTSKFNSDLILESERVRDSTFELPLIAFTIELEMKEILLLLLSLFCNNKSIDSSEPTGLSVLCIMYSREASSLRYNAASKAGSPAPTIATFLFLKKGPSQTAQYETPLPFNSFSPFTFKSLGVLPNARISVLLEYSLSLLLVFIIKSPPPSLCSVMESTSSYANSAPKFLASCSNLCISSKPPMCSNGG